MITELSTYRRFSKLNDSQPEPTRGGKQKLIIIPAILLIAIFALVYWLAGRGWESTDDAQVQGDIVPINARVSGYVSRILVEDNQTVSPGQMLVQLDQRDLLAKLESVKAVIALQAAQKNASSAQVSIVEKTSSAGEMQAASAVLAAEAAVAAARSQASGAESQADAAIANAEAALEAVASAKSDIDTAKAAVEAAQAAIKAAQADLSSAEAQAKKTAADTARIEALYREGATSKQQLDAMQAANSSAQAAVAAAKERVNSAKAALAQANARQKTAETMFKQAEAKASAAKAAEKQAQAGAKTARKVLAQAEAGLRQAKAAHFGAQTAPQQIAASIAQDKAAAARYKQAIADTNNIKLQLSYTNITSPVEGVVGQKSVQPGQFVQPSQMLMAVVKIKDAWIVANFKETQVRNMHPGQKAIIEVDTYHGIKIKGKVDSIGAATGSKFSLLPAENATGNFVKVVQRIPVKIIITQKLPKGVILRPGMNVVAKVRTS